MNYEELINTNTSDTLTLIEEIDSLITPELADQITVFGFPITFVGVIIAIWQIQKTKKSSDLAKQAVENFRNDLSRLDTINAFAEVITGITNVKSLIQHKSYAIVPDRLHQIRHNLIVIRESGLNLMEDQEKVFQKTITSFKLLENDFANRTSAEEYGEEDPKVLKKIIDHSDNLKAVQIQLRKDMERNSNE